MFPRARMGKISPFNQKKLVNQNFRDLFVEDFGSIWLINLFGLRGRLDGAHQQARCGEAAGHHRRHDGREQGPWQPAPGPQHSAHEFKLTCFLLSPSLNWWGGVVNLGL